MTKEMSIMKKINLLVVALAFVTMIGFVFTGFKAEAASEADKKAPVIGGWTLVTDNKPGMMSEADSSRIKNTIENEFTDYNVLGLVATQVVSGANYMYLVYGTETGSETSGYYFVTIYEDTKGNDIVAGIENFDVTAVQTAAPLGKGATGAWAVRGSGKPGMFRNEDVQASFDAVNKGDVMYNPVAMLATQVVSGTNYKALCKGNDSNLYVVTWYKDLQGNSTFTSAECVNIGAYSGR